MSFWNLFSPSKRAREEDYIRQLFHLALADDMLEEVERDYILSIGHKLGFSDERISELFLTSSEEDIRYLKPPSGEHFFSIFYLINLIRVDEEVHEDELKIARRMVMKLGYAPDTVDTILETIQYNQAQNISVEETYHHLKKRLS
jgi:uncharacterized tellurite resistance protein B-like protein